MPQIPLNILHIADEIHLVQALHNEHDGRVGGVPAGIERLRIPQVALFPAYGQGVHGDEGIVNDNSPAELGPLLARAKAGQRAFRAHTVNRSALRGTKIVLSALA